MEALTLLDHADFIARYDKSDALGVITGLPDQLRKNFVLPDGLDGYDSVHSIVLTGMGGSAQAGEFIRNWLGLELPVPLEIVRDYVLPGHVGANTLVIVTSYSGNTEETLSALAQARELGAKIVVMSSGGKLQAAATDASLPFILVPGGLQPRFAVLFAARALATLLEKLGMASGATAQLDEAGTWLAGELAGWSANVPTAENAAKQVAEALVGHVAVVYAGPTLAYAAIKLKIACNENAKNIAFYNFFPELNHNEFIGWTHPERSGLKVVELRSNLDHPQIQKRFDITNQLLSASFAPIQIQAKGETRLQQLVWTIALGEYIATYLAILNQVDPTPVDAVEKLKAKLA